MSELIPVSLFSQLETLSHLFVWRRKALHESIAQELRHACQRHIDISGQHHAALEQVQMLTAQRQRLNVDIMQLREECEKVKFDLAKSGEQYAQQALELSELKARHGDTWTRYDLVSKLLATRPSENAGLARFHELLENDFMAFAENVALKTEARALRIMQSIGAELEMLAGFPDVRQRNIVGIVEGFSSGKSEFINSFIDNQDIRLSVGIQPVTVIPSYVFAAREGQEVIRGYCANHSHVELDAEFYRGLSHAFIDTFNFDLRSLMPFICLGVRMDPAYFGNLCLIDTPGYNPPATSNDYSGGDKRTAVEFAQQANAIVWLIGLDATGTVPTSDIDFIREIGHDNMPMYVVLNKADLKPEEEIEAIMDEVEDILIDEEGFDICGICAYSSRQRRMFGFRKMELMDYFAQQNQAKDVLGQVRERLFSVFDMYDESLREEIDRTRKHRRALNGLKLDALEIGGSELMEKMAERIEKLDAGTNVTQLENMLKKSRSLRQDFSNAVMLSINGDASMLV